MGKVFLGLFALASLIHLYFSFRDDTKGRAYTKPWPLLMLVLFYAFSAMPNINILLILALITSWIGDVLLIFKGHKWFYAGGISFTFTHLFFMLVFTRHIQLLAINWFIIVPVAIIYVTISLSIVHILKDNTPKMLIPPMYGYLLCNSATNVFALMQLMSMRAPYAIVAYVGALLFFTSDCILYLVRYHPNENIIPKRHFPVMLCYLLGEFLITYGVLNL